ncbi:PAS domain-containing protein [Pseudenhygromyxa sp. WMMC2535]|uniref:PAS domain-containing sensor histidine kinase n=1 Tax=Pseudenhygromyxa sp. WMMC2535 TaxID=2712867 RepID=UPI001555A791|nr:ATP-binding protein [Pseudenhygromyxa sp. WMMC2535]NVB40400.1 PAS domain-containing protein [Pseudenhygromyxa sp. WMMC2535]
MSELDPTRIQAAAERVLDRLSESSRRLEGAGVIKQMLLELLDASGAAAGCLVLRTVKPGEGEGGGEGEVGFDLIEIEATTVDLNGALSLWLHDVFGGDEVEMRQLAPLARLGQLEAPLLLGYEPLMPAIDNLAALPVVVDGECAALFVLVNRGGGFDMTLVDALEPFFKVCRVATAQLLASRRERGLEAQCERGERRLRDFVDGSGQIALLGDEAGRLRWVSAGLVDRFQISAEEVVGRLEVELLPASLAGRARAIDDEVRETDAPVHVLEPALGPDKEIHWWRGVKFPIEGEDGARWYGGVVTDVSEEVRTSEVLREREGELAETQELGRIGRWTWTVQGDRLDWDAHFERLCGAGPAEGQGLEGLLAMLHPEDVERTRQALQVFVREGTGRLQLEHRLLVDGEIRELALTVRVRREGELGPVVQALAQDVSERRRLERSQREFGAKAHKFESLSVLVGGMAGELDELLSSALGNVGIALDELDPEGLAAICLLDLEAAADRTGQIVRQLLAFSRRGRFEAERLDLSSLIAGFAEPIHAVVPGEIGVRLSLHPELPPVEGDPAQLRHLVLELVSNGAEAIGEAGGELSLTTGVDDFEAADLEGLAPETSLDPGRYVWLRVRDSGAGIDAGARPRIFEPFFSTKLTGRGLGLAAALEIARAHSGGIMIEEPKESGAIFRVLLPALLSAESGESWSMP